MKALEPMAKPILPAHKQGTDLGCDRRQPRGIIGGVRGRRPTGGRDDRTITQDGNGHGMLITGLERSGSRTSPAGTTEKEIETMFHRNDLFHTGIGFDLRAPEQFGVTSSQIFAVAMEMIEYADRHGIDKVDFQEHHQSEDGYVPCPFLPGVAAAARTTNIAVIMGAVILPFHNPVEVAEQIAVADLLSAGRFYTVLAGGYSPSEFAAFGVSLKDRARMMEEGFDLILRALSGERFTHRGREVFVRPLPSRPPREIVYAGGGSVAAAKRAARFGLPMWPMNDDIISHYEQECARLGKRPGRLIRGITSLYVTEDPDRGWSEIGPHLLHYMQSYAKWSSDAETSRSPLHGLDSLEKIRSANLIRVVTPAEAIELGRTRSVGLQPLLGGLHPDLGWRSLEMFVEKVLPHIKDAPEQWRRAQGPDG